MKTTIYKGHNGWQAETMMEANANGEAWQINTHKTRNGVSCYAIKGRLNGDLFSYEMFGAKRLELYNELGQCNENKVKSVHSSGLIEFEKQIQSTHEIIKPIYEVKVGQIIFTDAIGNFEENKRVIYCVESAGNYKTVSLDGKQLRCESHIKPYSEKFGIGVYYNEGEILPIEEVEKLVLLAQNWQALKEHEEQERKEKENIKRNEDIIKGSKIIPEIPKGATHIIIASLHESQSDPQSDYFGHSVEKIVYLAFSYHGRDLFPELRKAAANFEETKHLSIEPFNTEDEHREKYSMGSGYYLGVYKNHSGWVIKKTSISTGEGYGVNLETLQIAAANDLYFISKEEEQKEVKTANFAPVPVETRKIQIIEYSEKSIAVIGDTRPIKDTLKELGGKFNFRLSCGCGWIFPKTKLEEIKTTLSK